MRRFVSLLTALCLAATMLAPAAMADAASIPGQATVSAAPVELQDDGIPAEPASAAPEGDKPVGVDAASLAPAPADSLEEVPQTGEAVAGTVDNTKDDVVLEDGELTEDDTADPEEEAVSVEIIRGSRDGSQALESAPLTGGAEGSVITGTVELTGLVDMAKMAAQYNEETTTTFTTFGDQLTQFNVSVDGTAYAVGPHVKTAYDALAADFASGQSGHIFLQDTEVPSVALYLPSSMVDGVSLNASGTALVRAMAILAGFAFDWDTPEMFWSNSAISYRAAIRTSDGACVISLLPLVKNEFESLSVRQSVQATVQAQVARLVANTDGMTERDALTYYHDWLCENNTYNNAAFTSMGNYTSAFPWSAASALLGNSGSYNEGPVCEGYARALQWLCKETGIQCILVVSDDHMWNNVVIDDKWTGVDVTFDDNATGYSHTYFLRDDLNGSANHHISYLNVGNGGYVAFAYPALGQVDQVSAFVTRLYTTLMDRNPDTDGKGMWVSQLKSGAMGGAEVAYGFVVSTELKNRNLTDDQYVEAMYETFMDRASDASGKASWLDWMAQGVSRNLVFKGFVESSEFNSICQRYGIERGTVTFPNYADQNLLVTLFVLRLYTKALDRTADLNGVEDWCEWLINGWATGASAAEGFFFGVEFTNKNFCNEHFLEHLYATFMDRTPSEREIAFWTDELESGMTREEVFNGFAMSTEFGAICGNAGIAQGQPITVPTGSGTVQNGPCSVCGKEDGAQEPEAPADPETPGETLPDTVWLANADSKIYHSDPTCSNMSTPVEVPLDEAQANGCRPCEKCC